MDKRGKKIRCCAVALALLLCAQAGVLTGLAEEAGTPEDGTVQPEWRAGQLDEGLPEGPGDVLVEDGPEQPVEAVDEEPEPKREEAGAPEGADDPEAGGEAPVEAVPAVAAVPAALPVVEVRIEGGDLTDGDRQKADWSFVDGVVTLETDGGAYVLAGDFEGNQVRVDDGIAVEVTMDSLRIDVWGWDNKLCAFSCGSGSDVTVTLVGNSRLASGLGYAGLECGAGSRLTLGGKGALEALGFFVAEPPNPPVRPGGAGIGGSNEQDSGTIVINDGSIAATGGFGSAGIGGGNSGSGGRIQITGGTVRAVGEAGGMNQGAAGIGGGSLGDSERVEISGGTVEARSQSFGAGIGGGILGSSGTVLITDGDVTATSSLSGGAGIGGGAGMAGTGGNSKVVRISGGRVTARSGLGAGIGAGARGGSAGLVEISGGVVEAESTIYGAGIGGGQGMIQNPSFPMEYAGAQVIISGGVVTALGPPSFDGLDQQGEDIGMGVYGTNAGSLEVRGGAKLILGRGRVGVAPDPAVLSIGVCSIESRTGGSYLDGVYSTLEVVGGWPRYAAQGYWDGVVRSGTPVELIHTADPSPLAHTGWTVDHGLASVADNQFVMPRAWEPVVARPVYGEPGENGNGGGPGPSPPPSGSGGGARSSGSGTWGGSPDRDAPTLTLIGLPETVRVGDRFTLTPHPEGWDGRRDSAGWTWDAAHFDAAFNSPATFTALREGDTRISFTSLNGLTASVEVEVLPAPAAEPEAHGEITADNPDTGVDPSLAALRKSCSLDWLIPFFAAVAALVLAMAVWAVVPRKSDAVAANGGAGTGLQAAPVGAGRGFFPGESRVGLGVGRGRAE